MPSIGGCEWNEIDWIVENAQKPESNNYARWCDWYADNQDRKTLEAEALKLSTIRNKIGWTHEGCMKRISSMPLHVFNTIRRVDPEFGRNTPEGRKKLYRFLLRHPQFSVR